ncbi:MAG: hypothetical protein JXB88_15945, partial [Spirochaetales bacterium]|nr:hypothetical protein [Spirochaetales bacterium]
IALSLSGVADIMAGINGIVQNAKGKSDGEYRQKTKGANKADRKNIDSVANKYKINRRDFGDFIESTKQIEGRGPSDNYTYSELCDLAKEFKELGY